jgi:ribonuclease HI
VLKPVEHDIAIRYLGVQCRFDGSWAAQHGKTLKAIFKFTRAVTKFSLPLRQVAYIFNVFLLPTIELGLRYVQGKGTREFLRKCDSVLVGAIKHAVQSPLQLSHSAVALALHFTLPSWLEAACKVSELFIRMNTLHCRWGRLGRALYRQELPAVFDGSTPVPMLEQASRIVRAATLALAKFEWKLELTEEPSERSRRPHLFDREPAPGVPLMASVSNVQSAGPGIPVIQLVQDHWTGWGAALLPQQLHVYTDGSHDASSKPHPTSSWAVTVRDEWLDSNFGGVPADEKQLEAQPAYAAGAVMFGASIAATYGVYSAELQAIARTLAMFPSSCSLQLHTDSKGAIAGIAAYERECNERRRLRMSARPLLQLIHSLLARRARAGGPCSIEHVKAHTQNTDVHSVGNRLADFQANRARKRPGEPCPLSLQELPLHECEHRMSAWQQLGAGPMLIDDIRRSAMAQLKAQALTRWEQQAAVADQGFIACAGLLQLGRAVLRSGSPELQATFVHVATNSVHFYIHNDGLPDSAVAQLPCEHPPCGVGAVLSLAHAVTCMSKPARHFRLKLRDAIVAAVSSEPCTAGWLRANSGLRLRMLLLALFPVPDSATPAESTRLQTRVLCGAFSREQENAAARALGFPSILDSRATLLQVRLLCLEHIQRFHGRRKAAAV